MCFKEHRVLFGMLKNAQQSCFSRFVLKNRNSSCREEGDGAEVLPSRIDVTSYSCDPKRRNLERVFY